MKSTRKLFLSQNTFLHTLPEKALEIKTKMCYIIDIKGAAAHKVVYLPEWLKPACLGKVQGRLIYFRLFVLSIQASSAIRKLPPKSNRLNTSYVSICTTSLLFQVREAYHLATRLLFWDYSISFITPQQYFSFDTKKVSESLTALYYYASYSYRCHFRFVTMILCDTVHCAFGYSC